MFSEVSVSHSVHRGGSLHPRGSASGGSASGGKGLHPGGWGSAQPPGTDI